MTENGILGLFTRLSYPGLDSVLSGLGFMERWLEIEVEWNLNRAFQIFEMVNLTIFSRYSGILNFNNLKPYRISNFTASTASDAVPHRRL